jgi:hypothetical protein
MMTRKILGSLCLLVLCGILVAGLWPFHAPKNEVRWLSPGLGLFFGKYGSIVSAAAFDRKSQRADNSCSLEIWLEPKRVQSSGTILAFYQPDSQVTQFSLRQSLGDLVLQRASPNELGQSKRAKIYVDDVFSHRQLVLVTISSNQSGTTVFSNGSFAGKFENFRLSNRDLNGRLIVGNSPVTTDDWSGQLRGIAVYDRDLTADEVSQHFVNWTTGNRLSLAQSQGAIAIYPFNEGEGNVVHNLLNSATDLLIPERFFVLHAQFLERPWDEFRRDWNYWKDVGINVFGFIPLGLFFCAYFSLIGRVKHPVAITIALGFAVSLNIEVWQAFLPTRDSGMTDLITNTLGTAIGAIAFSYRVVQVALDAAGFRVENANIRPKTQRVGMSCP